MAFPPTAEWCHIRQQFVIRWPQVWHHMTMHPGDTLLTREQALELVAEIQAGLDAVPEPDDEGMVHPARSRHLSNGIKPKPLAEVWDDEACWEPVPVAVAGADVPVKVAGMYTKGSGV